MATYDVKSQTTTSTVEDTQELQGMSRDKLLKLAQRRKQQRLIAETRTRMKDKVTKDYVQTVLTALNVFQAALRAEERAELVVEHAFGTSLKDKLLDKLIDISFDAGEKAFGVSGAAVFGAIKGGIDSEIKFKEKMTALDVTDHVISAVIKGTHTWAEKYEKIIAATPDGVIVQDYIAMAQFKNVKADDDAPENGGDIRDALADYYLEKRGLPKTGAAIMDQLAQSFVVEWHRQLMETKPVGQQVNDIQGMLSGKAAKEAGENVEKAEKSLGLTEDVDRDKRRRERVKAL